MSPPRVRGEKGQTEGGMSQKKRKSLLGDPLVYDEVDEEEESSGAEFNLDGLDNESQSFQATNKQLEQKLQNTMQSLPLAELKASEKKQLAASAGYRASRKQRINDIRSPEASGLQSSPNGRKTIEGPRITQQDVPSVKAPKQSVAGPSFSFDHAPQDAYDQKSPVYEDGESDDDDERGSSDETY